MDIPAQWHSVAETLVASRRRLLLIMCVGAPDTGKSTLAAWLASRLHEAGRRVGVIDCDLGQSSIGLPTTIGLGLLRTPVTHLEQVQPRAAYFVGAVSPVGHLLATVVGTRRMADRARAFGVEAIVVDTSGLVLDDVGRELKLRKAEVLRPSHIVALCRNDELAPLLDIWRMQENIGLFHLAPSAAAQPRLPPERRAFRQARFGRYFQQASSVTISLGQVALLGTRLGHGRRLPQEMMASLERVLQIPVFHAEQFADALTAITAGVPEEAAHRRVEAMPEFAGIRHSRWVPSACLDHLLIGLCDARGDVRGVGLLERLDFTTGQMHVLTPLRHVEQVRCVAFGSVRLAPDGTQWQTLPPGTF